MVVAEGAGEEAQCEKRREAAEDNNNIIFCEGEVRE